MAKFALQSASQREDDHVIWKLCLVDVLEKVVLLLLQLLIEDRKKGWESGLKILCRNDKN